MHWLIAALLAPVGYTLAAFVDKYNLARVVTNYLGLPIYCSIVNLIVGTLVWIVCGFPWPGARDALLVMLNGVFTMWGNLLYFKAISREETSQVIMLVQMNAVLVLIMSFIFLSETISALQFVGFLLILGPALAVSVENGVGGLLRLSPAFFQVLLADLLWAAAILLFKFAVGGHSFLEVVNYGGWGMALGGLVLYLGFPSIREAFHGGVATSRRMLGVVLFSEGLNVVGEYMFDLALALGPAALVTVTTSGSMVLLGILLGQILTVVAPAVFQEDISPGGLLKKLTLAVILVSGIWLVR